MGEPTPVRPVRVLVVGHTYAVPVTKAKLDAIAALSSVEVTALVPETWHAGAWSRRHHVSPSTDGARLLPQRVWFEGRAGAYVFPPRGALRAARDVRPDVIQVDAEAFGMVALEAALIARRVRIPLVLFCWENIDRPLAPPRRLARRFVLRTAAAVIAGSDGAAEMIRRWGFRGRIVVAPQLGVDPGLFTGDGPPVRDGFVVGFAGRLAPEKGVDLLLDATAALRGRGHDVRAAILGSGPDEAALRSHAVRLGIAQVVDWRGAVPHEHVPAHLASFDALVLPSRTRPLWREQFGHVLIEGMAAGVPVVGSSSGAIPEVIGRADLVFAEDDAAGLASLLERLVEAPSWRAEVAAWGRARVAERYTHDRIAARLADLYHDLVRVAS